MIQMNDNYAQMAKDWQKEDVEFVVKNGSCVLGHKTGMGKSVIGLAAATGWPGANRILVLGGKSAATTWNRQPMYWADTQTKFIAKAGSWDDALKGKEGIWCSTYDTFRNCVATLGPYQKAHWDVVIGDEAHKLRSRKTKWFDAMRRIDWDHFVPMSATWASRGPQDLWPILTLMDRKKFSSYWSFVNKYCFVEEGPSGYKEIFGVRHLPELQALMNGKYYRTRTWKEIGHEYPPVSRRVVPIAMSAEQIKVTRDLDKDMMAFHKGEMVITPNALSKMTRLYQLAVCPKLVLPSMGYGAGIEAIVAKLEDDPHTVIYTYYAEAIPIIEQALREASYTQVFSLRGGTALKVVDERVAAWKKHRGIMICSIRFAESFRIDTTNTAYVLGFSWDPNENIQAEGRLRAIDSPPIGPCVVDYYIMDCPIMKAVQDVVNEKTRTISQIFRDYIEIAEKEPL